MNNFFQSKIYIIVCIMIFVFIILKFINILYNNFFKKQRQLHFKFFKNLLQTIIIIIAIFKILSLSNTFNGFASAILTSSSLLVVVLGFAFQTSLEDFIAGVLISIFKPFNIDDKVNLTKLGISGKIENITIRHTVIRTFTNSRLIIPNSIMNKEIIENNHIVDTRSSNFLDICISYESDLTKAKEIIENCIKKHPLVIDIRNDEELKNGTKQINVFVRELGSDGIYLRTNIWTNNIDENFSVCSDLREIIKNEFDKNNIEIPYKHIKIT